MLTRKHDRALENINTRRQMGSSLKFLVNFKKSGSGKAKEKKKQIAIQFLYL
jgi:hypothetical protein